MLENNIAVHSVSIKDLINHNGFSAIYTQLNYFHNQYFQNKDARNNKLNANQCKQRFSYFVKVFIFLHYFYTINSTSQKLLLCNKAAWSKSIL
jgi:hypothetical protein